METTVRQRRSTGWQEEETERLFSAVREAAETGLPLRSVFDALSDRLGRKPNSIRNHYYACLREQPGSGLERNAPMRLFTPEETHELLRQVLMARGQGMSVRRCVMDMAQGDHSRMLRYQNKYRALLRQRPDLIDEVRQELKREGLPYPESEDRGGDVTFCAPGDTAAARLMAEPCVEAMLEGIKELLRRAARAGDAEERLVKIDRMRVEHDLQRLSWEKDFDEATSHLDDCLTLLRDFIALPQESQLLQLSTFRDAAMSCITQGETFLARLQGD